MGVETVMEKEFSYATFNMLLQHVYGNKVISPFLGATLRTISFRKSLYCYLFLTPIRFLSRK